MKCYYHRDREAIGLCKSCGKGLCDDCQTDLGKGLACKNRCEATVRDLIALIDQNVRATPTATAMLRLNRPILLSLGLALLLLGGLSALLGTLDNQLRDLILLGAFAIACGLMVIVLGRKVPRLPAPEAEKENK